MSTTTTIIPENYGDKADKKNIITHAAKAAAATGIGVAGATIIQGSKNDDVIEADEVIETADVVVAPEPVQTEGSMSASAAQPSDVPQAPSATVSDVAVEPQPVTSGSDTPADVINVMTEPTEPVTPSETNENVATTGQNTPETVNPGEIADAIIAEEQIDPNDIDVTNVVNFDEIGTVYTVDGESYTAAAFHDAAGNQLVMVDVDGDDVFDVITDMEGNMLAQVPGNLTVDDAELGIVDDGVYLAHHDGELTDEFGADSIAQDLLS